MKLKYDGPLSNFAFNFNLRRYTQVVLGPGGVLDNSDGGYAVGWGQDATLYDAAKVGRCRVTPG